MGPGLTPCPTCPTCPTCRTPGATIDSRPCSNGTRRRRLECRACGERWTHHDGPPPPHSGIRPAAKPRLKAQQVERILTHGGSISAIARDTGHCRATVAAILRGQSHTELCPELPRQAATNCERCVHWEAGRCGLGFQDPEIEGPGFAADCASFLNKDA